MNIESLFYAIALEIVRCVIPIAGFGLVIMCLRSLFRTCTTATTMAVLIDPITNEETALANWENSVGRAKSCDVFINYPVISRNHAVIFKTKEGWKVTDTGSQTGVCVNGEKISGRHSLTTGDLITFGTVSYKFQSYDNFSTQTTLKGDE